MHRTALALLLVTVALAAVAGCGPAGRGEGKQLENSLISAINEKLSADAPTVDLRSVTCNEGSSRRQYSCLVFLGVESDVFKVRYSVAIDDRDCWRADTLSVEALRAGPNSQPPESMNNASNLSGCLK